MARLLISVLSLFLVVSPGYGQARGGAGKVYNLQECIAIALANHPDVSVANASATAAAARLTAAFGAYLPDARFNASYGRQITNLREQLSFVNGVPLFGEPVPNSYTMNASANWVIFDGLRREANWDVAKSQMDATGYDIQQTRLDIINNVRRRFVAVLRATQTLQARTENLSVATATYDRVNAMYKAGTVNKANVLSQEVEVANSEFSQIQAENESIRAHSELLVAMGLHADVQVTFEESSMPTQVTQSDITLFRMRMGTEADAIGRAMSLRQDLVAARYRAESAEASVAVAQGNYLPVVGATAGYTWRNFVLQDFNRQGQVFVGLNLSLPIFDQFQTHSNIENARLSLVRQQVEVWRLEQSVRQSIQVAWRNLDAAERQIQVTERALRAAELNFEAATERFSVGSGNLLEVQTANSQLAVARSNRISAVHAYYDAQFQAEYSSGLLTE